MTYYIGPETSLCIQRFEHQEGVTATVRFGVTTPGGDLTVAQLGAIDNEWRNNWLAVTDSQVTVGPMEAYIGGPGGVPTNLIVSTVNPQAGTSALVRPPGVVSMIVSLRGTGIGRRNRGRMYIPWVLSEAQINEAGVLLAADQSAMQTRAEDWLSDTAGVAGIGEVCILHSTDTSSPAAVSQVQGVIVRPTIGVQRRRRP